MSSPPNENYPQVFPTSPAGADNSGHGANMKRRGGKRIEKAPLRWYNIWM